MIKEINIGNLEALCRGSKFLGSGGGGSDKHLRATVEESLQSYGPISLVSMDEIDDDDIIVPIGLAGSPVRDVEIQPFTQKQIEPVIQMIQKELKRPIKALMPTEIGGVNALTPFCIAGAIGLPILDADLKGRALPEISMYIMNIHGKIPHKAYAGNPTTGEVTILNCTSFSDLETQCRAYAQLSPRSTCTFVPSVLEGREAKRVAVSGTINQAVFIGQQLELDDLLKAVKGKIRCQGKVIDYVYEQKNGFLLGSLMIETTSGAIVKIDVKNEFLHLADSNDNVLVEAPDIITLLRTDDLSSILSDHINIGDEVICVSCRGPEVWYSDIGLALVRANPISSSQKLNVMI